MRVAGIALPLMLVACVAVPDAGVRPAMHTPDTIEVSQTLAARGNTAWPVPAEDTGMVTATSWETYEHYTFPYSQWSAEIRFPIRQTPNYWTEAGGYPVSHGGLTDSGEHEPRIQSTLLLTPALPLRP